VEHRSLGVAVFEQCCAAEAVDRPVARGGDDPAGRARWDATFGPSFNRLDEGVLDRLLGDIDIAESADQDCNRPSIFLAENSRDV
jgi:hypothetical protein